MALLKSKTAKGQAPVASLLSALVVGIAFEYVTEGALAAGDIIDLGPIEPGAKPYDVTLISEDLDTNGTPTITLSVGILNVDKTDLDTAFIAASTKGQTGGIERASLAAVYSAGPSATERRLGVKVVAGPATAAAAGKKIAVVLVAAG